MSSEKFSIFFVILTIILINKSIDCLNASEIDSFVLLHDRVKNTLIEIAINGRCHWPRPTVVYVKETSDKLYLPRATVLHRCSDQFACCPNPRHSCVAIEEEEVDIGFYVLTKSGDQITERLIEVLKFQNHTKCDCRRKTTPMDSKPKDILVSSESTKREVVLNKTTTESTESTVTSSLATTVPKGSQSANKTKSTTIHITQTLTTDDLDNFINSTKALSNEEESNNSSDRTTQTTKSITNITSLKPITWPKSDSSYDQTVTRKLTPKTTLLSESGPVTKAPRTTIKENSTKFMNPKTNSTNKSKNSFISSSATASTEASLPLATSQSTANKTAFPPLKSTIDYSGLEREDDLKPEEDVVLNNGRDINLFYTNSIFFRPLTTTPYRVYRFIEKVTKRCRH